MPELNELDKYVKQLPEEFRVEYIYDHVQTRLWIHVFYKHDELERYHMQGVSVNREDLSNKDAILSAVKQAVTNLKGEENDKFNVYEY